VLDESIIGGTVRCHRVRVWITLRRVPGIHHENGRITLRQDKNSVPGGLAFLRVSTTKARRSVNNSEFSQRCLRPPYQEKNMNRFTDYLYASVPSVCIALPVAQILPDLALLHGIEKLGIIGILAAGILFFVRERRSFIAKSGERLEAVEKRITNLELMVTTGNDKVVNLLGQQLDALREIKQGQSENFTRMWQLTLDRLQPSNRPVEISVTESTPSNES
jgi:hypothetical protein